MHLNNDAIVNSALGFIAGYVDTVGFISLFGLFTAHVTGNFILIGAELARPDHGVLIKLLAFIAFVLAVAMTKWLTIMMQRQEQPARKILLLMCADCREEMERAQLIRMQAKLAHIDGRLARLDWRIKGESLLFKCTQS